MTTMVAQFTAAVTKSHPARIGCPHSTAMTTYLVFPRKVQELCMSEATTPPVQLIIAMVSCQGNCLPSIVFCAKTSLGTLTLIQTPPTPTALHIRQNYDQDRMDQLYA